MFFTSIGRVYVERVHEIPDMGRTSKGRSIANLLELRSDEKIAALIRVQARSGPNKEDQTWSQPDFIFFATQQGIVKKTALAEFANIRKGGIIAIKIEDRDALIDAKMTSGHNEVVLITHGGMSIRFKEEDARPMGRPAVGVYGIDLETGDRVVAAAIVDPSATLLVAGENGIGKRTAFDEYRIQSRGGKGIITMRTGDKTGGVVGALTVRESDEIASFILGTSRTVAIELKRRERRREALRDTFLPRQTFAPPEADRRLDLDQLELCLSQLADRERSVVLLTFYGERPAAAVARELGLTEGNVRVVRHRALARLRKCVALPQESR